MSDRPLRILSLGAGVQSTALLLMSLRGELPRLDHVIFADTHAEPAGVYTHLEWLKGECARQGVPLSVVSAGNLRRDAIAFRRDRYNVDDPLTGRKGYASIPLFVLNPGGNAGTAGRIRRQCTAEYKINPVETFIRRELLGLAKGRPAPKRIVVEQWLGITWDESRRAKAPSGKKRRNPDGQSQPVPIWWKTHAYPLMGVVKFWERGEANLMGDARPIPTQRAWAHDGASLAMDRADCIAWLERNYPAMRVPRSACTFCPYRSNDEWRRMRTEDPASFADACDFDDAIRTADANGQASRGMLVGKPFVHRSCVPLRDADIDSTRSVRAVPEVDESGQMTFAEAAESECEGMCGV